MGEAGRGDLGGAAGGLDAGDDLGPAVGAVGRASVGEAVRANGCSEMCAPVSMVTASSAHTAAVAGAGGGAPTLAGDSGTWDGSASDPDGHPELLPLGVAGWARCPSEVAAACSAAASRGKSKAPSGGIAIVNSPLGATPKSGMPPKALEKSSGGGCAGVAGVAGDVCGSCGCNCGPPSVKAGASMPCGLACSSAQ